VASTAKAGPGKRLRVGIKYCGGCNPEYDRVAAVNRLAEDLREDVEFLPASAPDLDLVLAVQGCRTACADLGDLEETPLWIITGPDQAESFRRAVKEKKVFNPGGPVNRSGSWNQRNRGGNPVAG